MKHGKRRSLLQGISPFTIMLPNLDVNKLFKQVENTVGKG